MALIPMLASAASLHIDHVTAAGTDLKAMQARLASIGIHADYGGAHSNHATEMAIASFPDGSYLELIAMQPHADPKAVAAHYWTPYMRGNAGPCAWAIRVPDVAAEVTRLRSAGVDVKNPQRSGREKPDGTRLEWETADIGTEPNGTFFPFMIRDFTPREKRAFVQGHASAPEFTGITRVVIAVKDLDAAVARYRKAFALAEPSRHAGVAVFAGTPVVLASGPEWARSRVAKFGEGPCAFVLGMRGAERFRGEKTSFGAVRITWMDEAKLGWRLGVEEQ